jgi:hypothetical protein
MDTKAKNFIRRKLIPFILREHGTGFAMGTWVDKLPVGELTQYDGVDRRIPICGTAACIGGSACVVGKAKNIDDTTFAKNALGLTSEQANGLFFEWNVCDNPNGDCGMHHWPAKFAKAFEARKTPLGKAKVAAALLEEVVRTNGACLQHL